MDKYVYIAALAAVPALAAPAQAQIQAQETLSAEQIVAYKIMTYIAFVKVMEDSSLTWAQKAAQVAEINKALAQLNGLTGTVSEEDMVRAVNALCNEHPGEIDALTQNITTILKNCKAYNYYGEPALRAAVLDFARLTGASM